MQIKCQEKPKQITLKKIAIYQRLVRILTITRGMDILIAAGSLGRNLAKRTTKQPSEYHWQVMVKPGALDVGVLKTALCNTKCLSTTSMAGTRVKHIEHINIILTSLKHYAQETLI